MKVKEESEKVGLKLNIQKTKITASGPITSWQIDGEIMKTVKDFIFLASKITADGDCSHDIKKTLALWKKRYDQPRQHIRKQRHYFADKAMVLPVVTCGCENWSIKKAERRRMDAFELWCWRLLNFKEIKPVQLKGTQSWIFIGRTDAKAETPILWPPDVKKRPWCWGRLNAGGEGDNRGWDGWMASPTQRTWVWVNSENWRWTGRPGVL